MHTDTDVIGPHVIEPTDEETTYYYNNTRQGKRTIWACKYCNWSGIHPDKCEVNISIKTDCNGIEWLDSEVAALQS